MLFILTLPETDIPWKSLAINRLVVTTIPADIDTMDATGEIKGDLFFIIPGKPIFYSQYTKSPNGYLTSLAGIDYLDQNQKRCVSLSGIHFFD